MAADAVEVRVLGALIEKQLTTPDVYPLSLNALRAACNQSTSRDPVVAYDEATVRAALDRLGNRRWTRLASASRAAKFRHLLTETMGLGRPELAVLAVLLLRGPQTASELRARTDRLHAFGTAEELQLVLDGLVGKRLAALQERRAGRKGERYAQLLGVDAASPTEPVASAPAGESPPDALAELEARVAELERRLDELAG
jgi:uncharacterized protein